ncbi:hypothetical protein ACFVSW_12910 [Neobacillus sp. NPDC058068]|uniref:hypothetical protein n=1 Tax=Neobacillus sp. NPDC058068 TaxID=3346325 RepID=UPI0036DCA08F
MTSGLSPIESVQYLLIPVNYVEKVHLIQTSLRRKINSVNYSLKRAIDETEALRRLVKKVQII